MLPDYVTVFTPSGQHISIRSLTVGVLLSIVELVGVVLPYLMPHSQSFVLQLMKIHRSKLLVYPFEVNT